MHHIDHTGFLKALVLVISLCVVRKSEATNKILIVGDSMGEFMGKTLESICIGSEVQNAAIGGTTAVDWTEYTSDVLKGCAGGEWDVVYIAVGGNDLLQSGCALTADELSKKILSAVTNIITNIVPKASKYLLTGYCMPSGIEANERNMACAEPSDFVALSEAFLGLDTQLPKNVEVIDSITACGGSTSSFSDPAYFQDAIHLNNKGYCKVFTQPDVLASLGACAKIFHNCDSPEFEITGLDEKCDDSPTSICTDDTAWKRKSKTCAWVAKKPERRCKKKSKGVEASIACPIACGSTKCTIPVCRKNSEWTLKQKNGKFKNCNYLKTKTKRRCGGIGIDNIFGYEACKVCRQCKRE